MFPHSLLFTVPRRTRERAVHAPRRVVWVDEGEGARFESRNVCKQPLSWLRDLIGDLKRRALIADVRNHPLVTCVEELTTICAVVWNHHRDITQ